MAKRKCYVPPKELYFAKSGVFLMVLAEYSSCKMALALNERVPTSKVPYLFDLRYCSGVQP